MRVCLVLPELRPAGGHAIVLGHAARLDARDGWDVDVVALDGARGEVHRDVKTLDQVADEHYDVAVATWWETVPAVLGVRAERRALFVQSAEERFYRRHEPFEQLGPALALSAPVHFFAVARWLCDLVTELRPGSRCWYTPNGIDKATFTPRSTPIGDGPLRILIEGQPSLWFKGVEEALEAVSLMTEPHTATLVALDPEQATQHDGIRVVGGLGGAEMRQLYEEHDVLLKLSRIESVGLAVVEACHVGTPAVVTPYTGHEEIVRHGENGIVVGFDDPEGCAHALDGLARDRETLQALSDRAVETMRDWPSDDEATEAFAAALQELGLAREPDPQESARTTFARWRAATEIARVARGEAAFARRELEGSVQWLEEALESARAHVDELARSRDAVAEDLRTVERSPVYRAANVPRKLLHRARRR